MKPVIGIKYLVQYKTSSGPWQSIWNPFKGQELSFDTIEEARNEVKEWGRETRIRILKSEVTIVT